MKKSLTFWNLLPALLIMSGVLLLISRYLIKRKSEESQEPATEDAEAEVVEEEEEPLSIEQRVINNYKVIRAGSPSNISDDFVKILTAQSMHETGNFKSRLYLEQNNMFGMIQPNIRETLSTGEKRGFANFASMEDSVKDLYLYFKEFNIKPTYKDSKDYVKDIRQAGYFTAPFIDYHNAVRSHLATVKSLIQ